MHFPAFLCGYSGMQKRRPTNTSVVGTTMLRQVKRCGKSVLGLVKTCKMRGTTTTIIIIMQNVCVVKMGFWKKQREQKQKKKEQEQSRTKNRSSKREKEPV